MVGAVVKLKSGGPPMTVVMVDGQFFWCEWFEGTVLKSHEFPSATLEPTSDHLPFIVLPKHPLIGTDA